MEIRLNLARKPYLNRKRARVWLSLACGILGFLLALNLHYGYQNYQQMTALDERSRELEAQVSSIQGAPEGFSPAAYAAALDEVAFANLLIGADQFQWTRLLGRLETLLPADVSISTLQPNFETRSLQITAMASDVSAMTAFIDNLLKSDDLNQAYLLAHADAAEQAGAAGAGLVSFSLQVKEAF